MRNKGLESTFSFFFSDYTIFLSWIVEVYNFIQNNKFSRNNFSFYCNTLLFFLYGCFFLVVRCFIGTFDSELNLIEVDLFFGAFEISREALISF
jgi:hypothetical protein